MLVYAMLQGEGPFGLWKDSELQVYTRIARRSMDYPDHFSAEAVSLVDQVRSFFLFFFIIHHLYFWLLIAWTTRTTCLPRPLALWTRYNSFFFSLSINSVSGYS